MIEAKAAAYIDVRVTVRYKKKEGWYILHWSAALREGWKWRKGGVELNRRRLRGFFVWSDRVTHDLVSREVLCTQAVAALKEYSAKHVFSGALDRSLLSITGEIQTAMEKKFHENRLFT